uniref:HMG box domain-containing protein n=1 Tax=viral metagenome TaxID=1070528 RepID=A0A6C0HLZ1_9ZZZZ
MPASKSATKSVNNQTMSNTKVDTKLDTTPVAAKPVEDSADESNENTTAAHGVLTGRINANPAVLGLFLIDMMEVFKTEFDGMPIEDMLKLIYGSLEDLKNIISKAQAKHRKTIANPKFVPKGLTKPANNARNLFAKKLKASGETCTMEVRNAKWASLDDKEKAKLQKEYEVARDAYKEAIEQQRIAAISNGEFPEDKPSRGLTAYFHFLKAKRPELKTKHGVDDKQLKQAKKNGTSEADIKTKKMQANLAITKEGGELWRALSDEEKAAYIVLQKADQEKFAQANAEWKKRDNDRLRKQGKPSEEAPIEIESSEPKHKPVAAINTPAISTPAAKATEQSDDDDDSENVKIPDVTQAVVEPTPKKSSAKTAAAKGTPSKGKAATQAKKPTKVPSDDEDDNE